MEAVGAESYRDGPPSTGGGATHFAFAPVHKRALGTAVGMVSGVGLFALTAFHVLLRPVPAPDLNLLAQYFYGYRVSWGGAFIGLCWGFVTGFVAGWFLAFVRNLAVAATIFTVRTAAELSQTRDFLDHI